MRNIRESRRESHDSGNLHVRVGVRVWECSYKPSALTVTRNSALRTYEVSAILTSRGFLQLCVIVALCTTRKFIKKITYKNGEEKYGDYGILIGKMLRNSYGNMIQRLLL